MRPRRPCYPRYYDYAGRLEVDGRPIRRSELPSLPAGAQYVMYNPPEHSCAEVAIMDESDGRIIERRGEVLVIRATDGVYRYRLTPCRNGSSEYVCAERLRD